MIVLRFGGSAAADEGSKATAPAEPISLAGRWIGHDYGYGRTSEDKDCSQDGCRLAYDIVACKEGWCGIVVKDDKSCGSVGLHLTADTQAGARVFKGRLELAKGAALYAVQAWRNIDEKTGAVDLHFIGNTGSELLLFRRSYPFEAYLTREGDAMCTLEKATS